jgi:hypothetical protein
MQQIPTDRQRGNAKEKVGAFRRLSGAFIAIGRKLLGR